MSKPAWVQQSIHRELAEAQKDIERQAAERIARIGEAPGGYQGKHNK